MYHLVHAPKEYTMGHKQIDVTATTTARPSDVYALLRDGSTWPTWSPLGSFELEREGASEREGLGAIRIFKTGRTRSCEEIVELIPDRRLSYALRSGLPLRGYRADVDLEPIDGGTTIHWRSSFDPKVPGTGWFYRLVLARFIARTARGLADYAATAPRVGSASTAGTPQPA
jgi:hypothetical protein